jgi:hypothetical protein
MIASTKYSVKLQYYSPQRTDGSSKRTANMVLP